MAHGHPLSPRTATTLNELFTTLGSPGVERPGEVAVGGRDAAQDSVSVDFDSADEPVPCLTCSRWWAERAMDSGGVQVRREWHAPGCPTLRHWE